MVDKNSEINETFKNKKNNQNEQDNTFRNFIFRIEL